MKFIRVFSYLIILLISFGSYSNMLDFLKPYSYILSPDVSGVVTKTGEVYQGLKITLDVEYGDSYFTFDSVTDEFGRFSFDEVILHRWTKPFKLNNNVVAIRIFTNFNGVEKQLWGSYIGKLSPMQFIVDNLNDLECDIDSDKYQFEFENEKKDAIPYSVYGICNLKGYIEKFNKDNK
ncbi:DUF6795 domain-containing protein [Vibrio penaeicida]|uniref:DUF6795 domain-containing protein n=1 Tax=Vibrio penaeicida TaxID=104609 RepID=UPI0011AB712F|nr:DUF6795 domain-containing protein [Vibrio penaeicida]